MWKNDQDFNDMSDSVTVLRVHIIIINNKSVRVLCEQTGWLLTNKSPRSYFHHISTLEKTLLVNISF